jgi:hypothetical protein
MGKPTCVGLVALESSGADSSGLTQAMLEIYAALMFGSSEQHVVVWAFVFGVGSLSAGDGAGISHHALSRLSRHPHRSPIPLDMLSRIPMRALVSRSDEGAAPLVCRISKLVLILMQRKHALGTIYELTARRCNGVYCGAGSKKNFSRSLGMACLASS